ncbi:MAG: molybdopterin-dependent oxidoreductase, partial [Burkholderiaceae bacterium]|nr:molybdopterin-dependent oxidoreductase [Burkholderiaceae bacterium]
MPINRSFRGRNLGVDNHGGRLPPGQSLTERFPVLTAGPSPFQRSAADWTLTLNVGPRQVARWTWADFQALPQTEQLVDIHCVTTWSKFDTNWEGVLVDDILAAAGVEAATTPYTLAHSYDGYSTNVPFAD